jgi:hypothetical protein
VLLIHKLRHLRRHLAVQFLPKRAAAEGLSTMQRGRRRITPDRSLHGARPGAAADVRAALCGQDVDIPRPIRILCIGVAVLALPVASADAQLLAHTAAPFDTQRVSLDSWGGTIAFSRFDAATYQYRWR